MISLPFSHFAPPSALSENGKDILILYNYKELGLRTKEDPSEESPIGIFLQTFMSAILIQVLQFQIP